MLERTGSRSAWAILVGALLSTGPARAQSPGEIHAQSVGAAATTPDIAPTGTDKFRYALWELVPLGLDPSAAEAMIDMLRGELEKVVGDRLIVSARAVEPDVQRAIDECADRLACLSDATGAFGAQRAIFGVVTNLGDTYNMSLKLLDVRRREVVARESATLSGDRNQLLKEIEILLFKLIAPNRLLGRVALSIDVAGADIYVDGVKLGTTPLAAELPSLPEGEHSLKVSAPRIEDYFTFFTVHYGKTTEIKIDATRLKEVEASLEVNSRALRPVIVAAKIGYGSNLGKLSSPTFALEVGVGLWAISRSLFIGVEASYLAHEDRATTAQGERVTTALSSAPVIAWVGAELPLTGWSLFGRGGAGAAFVSRSLASPSIGKTISRGAEPAFCAAAGARLPLGPGAFLAEASYLYTLADNEMVPGSVGGLRGLLGYRLEI